MNPAHVVMTADAVGGVWTYALDLASAFAGRGVRTTLAVLGPAPSPAQRAEAGAIAGLQLLETGLPLDWLAEGPGTVKQSGRRLAALAAGSGADMIHLNSPALAVGGPFHAPVVGVCHSCLATWWDAVRGGRLPEDFAWRTEQLAAGYGACDLLIAPSFAFMQATTARYGRVPRVVRNGRSTDGRRLARAEKRPFVFASGRFWDEAKNVRALDEAAMRMRRGQIYAAGPLAHAGAVAAPLRAAIELGRLSAPSVSAWLNRAAVFTSLALYEPFGLGVLEAAQAGCALVLSDIATHRELWEGAAVFVDPADADGVAGALDRLVVDADEALRLGALAERRARSFTAAAMADGVMDAYRQLTARHAAMQEAAA